MLPECKERPLTQKTDPPLPQAPPHQLLPSEPGQQAGVGLQGKHRRQYLACLHLEPASHTPPPGVRACPKLVTEGKAEG